MPALFDTAVQLRGAKEEMLQLAARSFGWSRAGEPNFGLRDLLAAGRVGPRFETGSASMREELRLPALVGSRKPVGFHAEGVVQAHERFRERRA